LLPALRPPGRCCKSAGSGPRYGVGRPALRGVAFVAGSHAPWAIPRELLEQARPVVNGRAASKLRQSIDKRGRPRCRAWRGSANARRRRNAPAAEHGRSRREGRREIENRLASEKNTDRLGTAATCSSTGSRTSSRPVGNPSRSAPASMGSRRTRKMTTDHARMMETTTDGRTLGEDGRTRASTARTLGPVAGGKVPVRARSTTRQPCTAVGMAR
jgi:hypothetical protein